MTPKHMLFSLIVLLTMLCGSVVIYKFIKHHNNEQESTNWEWDDAWEEKEKEPEAIPKEPEIAPTAADVAFTAENYLEAVKKSTETGKPILVFFTADWCTWCIKMKKEVLPHEKVSIVLKKYILVFVDFDKEKDIVNKFGVTHIPACVITNAKSEKTAMMVGYRNAEQFSNWLNNPTSEKVKNHRRNKNNSK